MTLRKVEDIPGSALRDHGSRERVDRVWRRLASDMESAAPQRRSSLWWAPAAAALLFGSGVVVGAHWARPEPAPLVSAEPLQQQEERPAATLAPAAAAEEPRVEPRPVEPPRTAPRPQTVREELPPVISEPPPAQIFETPVPAGPPQWKQLADSGDFEAAARALNAAGGFDSVLFGSSSAQLMSLVDIARATGSRERALSALRRVVEAFPSTPEAPLAAWTLGNMLEQAGDEAGAAQAFALYRRLSPSGDFAEDAAVREVDAAFARGNLELAAKLIEQYGKDYPYGRRLDEFRKELEERRAVLRSDEAAASSEESEPAPVEP